MDRDPHVGRRWMPAIAIVLVLALVVIAHLTGLIGPNLHKP